MVAPFRNSLCKVRNFSTTGAVVLHKRTRHVLVVSGVRRVVTVNVSGESLELAFSLLPEPCFVRQKKEGTMDLKTAIVFFILGIGEGIIVRDWFVIRFGITTDARKKH